MNLHAMFNTLELESSSVYSAATGGCLSDLVEDSSGTRLEISSTNPELGRVLIATRSYDVGEIVFRERPVAVWNNGDWTTAMAKFHALPMQYQQAILDMHFPPLDSRFCAPWKAISYIEARRLGIPQHEMLFKLMVIVEINAHGYSGCQGAYQETLKRPDHPLALFLWGSKVAHSCEPNLSYSSSTSDGKLEYKVIRPIQVGDMLTFSYIMNPYEIPTSERRARLLRTKNFWCRCPRCIGPDYCRQVKCDDCSAAGQGTILCRYVESPLETVKEEVAASPEWFCSGCGHCQPSTAYVIRITEAMHGQMVQELSSRAQMMPYFVSQNDLDGLIERISSRLSPIHHLAFEALGLKVKVFASRCFFKESCRDRLIAAQAGLELVRRIECCEAQCNGIDCHSFQHPVVYACTPYVFQAAEDLLRFNRSGKAWPPAMCIAIKRYLPSMDLQYGVDDGDVKEIRGKLNVQPAQGGSTTQKKTAAAGNRRRNKKKKKRGKMNHK